jgi:NTE family protein
MTIDLLNRPETIRVFANIKKLAIDLNNSDEINSKFEKFFWLKVRHKKNDNSYRFITTQQAKKFQLKDDEDEFWICNIILQGGGTLGLAHGGFIAGLEQAGIRFAGVAGASAGAILSMGLAAIRGDKITKATHPELIELVEAIPMDTFLDGPRPIRTFIKQALLGRPIYMPRYWYGLLAAIRRILSRRGLNKGLNFEEWLQKILTERGMETVKDLNDKLDQVYHIYDRANSDISKGENFDILNTPSGSPKTKAEPLGHLFQSPKLVSPADYSPKGTSLLRLMATSMPTGVKFSFPADLIYLHPQYSNISPARLVRASMAIPLFFEPIFMYVNRKSWEGENGFIKKSLENLISSKQRREFEDLEEIGFLDGGLFSNLPTDAFQKTLPEFPTVAVPLVQNGTAGPLTRYNSFKGLLKDAAACASVIRLQRDRDAIIRRKRDEDAFNEFVLSNENKTTYFPRSFPFKITEIDTGEANWLNFVMSSEEKSELFDIGLKRAEKFIMELTNDR